MKKYITKTIGLTVIVAAMASCSQEIAGELVNQEQPKEEVKTLCASIGNFKSEMMDEADFSVGSMAANAPQTRSTIVTDINGDLQLVWSDKDTLGIFSTSGYQLPFPIGSEAGDKSATFDGGGWGLITDGVYSAYTPLIGNLYLKKDNVPLVLLTQTQNGNGSFEHLNKYDYMAAVNATVNQSGGVEFNFEHLVAILHMQIKMPKGGVYKYVILETSDKFTTEAKLDLSDGSVTMTKQSPIQAMKLENVDVVEGENGYVLEIYMSILPADLTDKVLYTKVYDEDNICYSTTMQAKNFEAGVIYNSRKIAAEDLTHSGLPVTIINTPNNQDITSKEEYIENTLISIFQTDIIDEFCELTNMKGRGNSTWNAPKKPYAIKFDKKKSLISLPEDKSWVLLANYFDETLLRNDLAFFMGHEISSLEWTPHFYQVDLVLNGQYRGIYQLGEKVKISKKRVNVGDDGFLFEIDNRAYIEDDARYFSVSHLPNPINIKDPEVEYFDDDYNYAKEFVTEAEAALYSDGFTDVENGWQKYMDLDSFVEWYLMNEISKNADACVMFSSCYMNLKRGDKLKMGPLWDYDLAFGGYPVNWSETTSSWANDYEGFKLKETGWYVRLFEDPAFVSKVKERFNYYYSYKTSILNHLEKNASLIEDKMYEENKMWGRVCNTSSTPAEVKEIYQQKVDYLKTWLSNRLDWLNVNINAL